MLRFGLILTAIALLSQPCPVIADRDPPNPDPLARDVILPPDIVLAKAATDDTVTMKMVQATYVTEKRIRETLVNGQVVKEEYDHNTVQYSIRAVPIKLDGKVKIMGLDGKPVDAKKALELLKDEKPVLLTAIGSKDVDPKFLSVVKEGTLIFVLPSEPPKPIPVPDPKPEPKPMPKGDSVLFAEKPNLEPETPASIPPSLILAKAQDADTIVFHAVEYTITYTQREVEKIIDGKVFKEVITEAVPTPRTKTVLVKFDKITKVQGIDGKAIDSKKVVELLKDLTPVLVVRQKGDKVDPAYLSIFKEGTLVFVLPPLEPQPPKDDGPPRPPKPIPEPKREPKID